MDQQPGTHNEGRHSMAGSSFWVLLSSFILFVIGYSTMGWQRYRNDNKQTYWVGLWTNCICDDVHIHEETAWFKGSQAMFTLALMFMIVALVMLILYMFVDRVPKNVVLIVACTTCFMAFIFLLVGVCVFGAKTGQLAYGGGHQGYSYAFTVIAMMFTLVSAFLTVYQMRLSGMLR